MNNRYYVELHVLFNSTQYINNIFAAKSTHLQKIQSTQRYTLTYITTVYRSPGVGQTACCIRLITNH